MISLRVCELDRFLCPDLTVQPENTIATSSANSLARIRTFMFRFTGRIEANPGAAFVR